jgi:hypothetical protein
MRRAPRFAAHPREPGCRFILAAFPYLLRAPVPRQLQISSNRSKLAWPCPSPAIVLLRSAQLCSHARLRLLPTLSPATVSDSPWCRRRPGLRPGSTPIPTVSFDPTPRIPSAKAWKPPSHSRASRRSMSSAAMRSEPSRSYDAPWLLMRRPGLTRPTWQLHTMSSARCTS